MSFLFLRSWLALFLLSILFCSFLCFLVKAVTDTLPKNQVNTRMYHYVVEDPKSSHKYTWRCTLLVWILSKRLVFTLYEKLSAKKNVSTVHRANKQKTVLLSRTIYCHPASGVVHQAPSCCNTLINVCKNRRWFMSKSLC